MQAVRYVWFELEEMEVKWKPAPSPHSKPSANEWKQHCGIVERLQSVGLLWKAVCGQGRRMSGRQLLLKSFKKILMKECQGSVRSNRVEEALQNTAETFSNHLFSHSFCLILTEIFGWHKHDIQTNSKVLTSWRKSHQSNKNESDAFFTMLYEAFREREMIHLVVYNIVSKKSSILMKGVCHLLIYCLGMCERGWRSFRRLSLTYSVIAVFN